jgi:hypothetical protein
VDSLSRRAIEDYHRLLEDDVELRREVEERFLDQLAAARLSFGGRALCTFPRPNLISPDAYEQVCGVCRGIFRAIERVERELGEELWDRVELSGAERELMAIDPGYARSSPLARLDSFLTTSAYQFVELNAETPAGSAYNDVLSEVFLELEPMRRFAERWEVRSFHVRQKLLETLLRCYREAGGERERPCIAVVDYEEVPTRTEHHMFRDFFESKGYPSLVCDPRHMEYVSGELRSEGQRVDIVYKRLLVNELLERRDQLDALMDALGDRAAVLVNPFRCKPIHKKAIFAVLTDDEILARLAPTERSAILQHVPWTRRVVEGPTHFGGEPIDLLPFIRSERSLLAIKPNDEYGGKGVFLGWELDESAWDAAIDQALAGSYVVQRRVELQRQRFPRLAPGLEFADLVVDLDPFLFDGEVEGFLTRLSGTSLANVSSGGGQVPSFVVRPR